MLLLEAEQVAGDHSIFFGIAAVLTATAGVVSLFKGNKKIEKDTRDDCDADCLRRLRSARAEAEDLAEEVHDLRMSKHSGETI